MKKTCLLFTVFFLISCGPKNTIQKDAVIKSLELAPGAASIMVSYMLNDKYYIWHDKKIEGPYDFLFYPRFSQSPYEPALLTTFQRQGQWYVRFKGFEYGPYGKDTQAPHISLSPMNDISISFKRDGAEYFLYNDQILGPYLKTGGWTYSPNAEHYAFWYVDVTNFAYEVDGERFSAGPDYQAPFFMPDDAMGLIRTRNKKLWLTIENREMGPFDFALPPVFSAHGKDYALLCDINGQSYVYTRNKKWGPYLNVLGSPAYSPDESVLTFIYTRSTNEREYFLHLADEELGPFQFLMPVQWSDQGPSYAFLFSLDNQVYLNYNGNIRGPFSRFTDIKFNQGSLYLATLSNHQVLLQNLD